MKVQDDNASPAWHTILPGIIAGNILTAVLQRICYKQTSLQVHWRRGIFSSQPLQEGTLPTYNTVGLTRS